jgi:SPP1 family predicted phage head-tail adaptor
MQAGRLNTRCVIQRRTGGTNDWGEPLPEGWETHATVWANVKHLSGSEAIKADAEVSTVRASIHIRHRSDITAGMRVLIGLAVYDIEAVLSDTARREFVDLACKAVQ